MKKQKETQMKEEQTEKCDCEEKSCKEGCLKNHTHKGFFCEKCHKPQPEKITTFNLADGNELRLHEDGSWQVKVTTSSQTEKCDCKEPRIESNMTVAHCTRCGRQIYPSEESWEKEFVEKGATLEHERWAGWQKYLHSKLVKDINEPDHFRLPTFNYAHWERQIATPYEKLSEQEKESDRIEVRKYLPLIRNQLALQKKEIVAELEGRLCLLGHTEDPRRAVRNIHMLIYGVNPPNKSPALFEALGKAQALDDVINKLR